MLVRSRWMALGTALAAAGVSLAAVTLWPSKNTGDVEPFYAGLGTHHRGITTREPAAQRYFDQGLNFLFGFKFDAALRSFQAAARVDPQCAMAHWGIAMANGPHINNMQVGFREGKAAWQGATRAKELCDQSSPVERALIEAVLKRFPYPPPRPQDRRRVDLAYAEAMRRVFQRFPNDADVGALTASALIELHPWDQWTKEGKPGPDTEELLHVLDAVLAKAPRHPYALHLLIHAVEGSPHPEKGDHAAELLRDMTPGIEHLVHMPSHIDVRRGRWQDAIAANDRAIAAEQEYRRVAPHSDSQDFAMLHANHMLLYAATMCGQSARARQSMQAIREAVPEEFLQQHPAEFDDVSSMPYELHLRFGEWDSMLAEPQPSSQMPISVCLWHYARGIAFAAKKDLANATKEREEFERARGKVLPQARFFRADARSVLALASAMLDGEIAFRRGDIDFALGRLRSAVSLEDDLPYADPPIWLLPARHALGAVLLDLKKDREAEMVYRADLAIRPGNGWSLFGLSACLRRQGKDSDAALVDAQFANAWKGADTHLSASCFCLARPQAEVHSSR